MGALLRCRQGASSLQRAVASTLLTGSAGPSALRCTSSSTTGAPTSDRGSAGCCARRPELGPFDAIVPIPLTHARLVERGYNQAALLAREVALALHRPLFTDRLARRRFAGSQTKLARAERSPNVRDAFHSRPVQGRVLLIDDVTTTGATFAEAAHVLRDAGASEVVALALCRTP